MADAGKLTLTVVPNMDKFARDVKAKAITAGSEAGTGAGQGFGDKFKSAVGKWAPAVAGALSVAGIANWAKDGVMAASDFEESVNAVRVVFKDGADEILKLGESAATSYGMSATEFQELTVMFSTFGKTVSGSAAGAVDTVEGLMQRATDFASVMNLDVTDAANTFRSAMAGEAEGIAQFGIDMSETAVQAYALAQGLIAPGEEMSRQTQAQARYGLLMESTSDTAGDFANTQDGLANTLRRLQPQFDGLKRIVGEALLPVFTDLALFAEQVLIPAAVSLMEWVAELGHKFEAFRQRLIELKPWIIAIGSVIMVLIMPALVMMAAQAARTAAVNVAAWLMMKVNAMASAAAQVATIIAMGVKMVWLGIQSLLMGAKMALGWLIGLGPIGLVIAAIVAVIAIVAVVIANWDTIKKFFSDLWTRVKEIFSNAWANLKKGAANAWAAIKNGVKSFFRAVLNIFTFQFRLIFAAWGKIRELWPKAKAAFQQVINGAKQKFNEIVNAVRSIKTRIVEAGRDLVRGIWEGIQAMAGWIKDKIFGFVGGLVDGAKSALGINSPSRVFMEIGHSTGEGLAAGIQAEESAIRRAGAMLGEAAIPQVEEGAIPMLGGAAIPSRSSGAVSPSAVAGMSSSTPVVRVFLGDDELRHMVRTEVEDADEGRRLTAAMGGRYA